MTTHGDHRNRYWDSWSCRISLLRPAFQSHRGCVRSVCGLEQEVSETDAETQLTELDGEHAEAEAFIDRHQAAMARAESVRFSVEALRTLEVRAALPGEVDPEAPALICHPDGRGETDVSDWGLLRSWLADEAREILGAIESGKPGNADLPREAQEWAAELSTRLDLRVIVTGEGLGDFHITGSAPSGGAA